MGFDHARTVMGTIGRWLPKGGKLPPEIWVRRHRTIVTLLWLHVPGVLAFGLIRGFEPSHLALEALPIATLAFVGGFLPLRRRVRAAATTIGLVTCSAVLVHLSGGLVEMHFHFFIMIGILTMYEDWFPFLLSIAYVVVHHGFMGAIDPRSVYNHQAAWNHPWRWGAIHGVFVLGASVISVLAWRRNEEARASVDASLARVTASEIALREAQELARVGSWSLDLATMSLSTSEELRRLYASPSALEWQHLADAVHMADAALVRQCLDAAVADGTAFDIEHRIVVGEGEVKWLHSRGSATRDGIGRFTGLHGTAQDITERKLIDAIVAESRRREQDAADVLREADEMKTHFLRALSHDLRTPLSVVMSAAELLNTRLEQLTADQAREILGRIAHQSKRLLGIFTDLLDLERLSAGAYEPRRERIDVAPLVCHVIEDRLADSAIEVSGDATALIDRVQVERMIDNLVSNALKHTPDGTPVHIAIEPLTDGVRITVADEGPGVPDELKASVFEPFRRGASAAPGTGVGLSLVAKFAEIHGGRAWVEDRPGGGAAFKVDLPNSSPVGVAGDVG